MFDGTTHFLQRIACALLTATLLTAFPHFARAQAAQKPDSGKFLMTIQESEVGTDTFTTDAEGGSESDVALHLGGQALAIHNSVKMKAGRLVSVMTDAGKQGKFTLTVQGTKGQLQMDKSTKPLKLPERPFPFSNFGPHHMQRLIAAYDLVKGGPQKFDLLAVDGLTPTGLAQIKATLTSAGAKPRQVAGKTVPVSRYVLTVAGAVGNIDIDLLADSDRRLLLWNVSAQKYLAVRDGYQELAKADTPDDPLLSKPTYTVTKETKVLIPMRDGIKLAADITRPDAPGRFPVILQRTPYGRTNAFEATFYARRGYVFVAQDVRGKFDSEGEWQPFVREARDGYDTVEWCAAQPWSTGDVGMIGGSYLGFTQWAAAREGSKHLKCLIPIVSPPDPFFNIPYAYGALFLAPSLWWVGIVDGKTMNPIKPVKDLTGLKTLPLTEIDKAVFGHHVSFFQEWLKHSTNDAYWDQVNFNERMASFGPLPALHVSGWFDGDGIGTKRNYMAMVAGGQKNQKLIYGPWGHAVNATTKLGPLDFGPDSLRDLDTLYLRWFDRWLKGVDNGIDREPPVDAFLMGSNRWRTFSAWPPQEATLTKWYLHSKGHANADKSDGALSTEMPSASEPADHYTYDPAKPFVPDALKKALQSGKDDDMMLTALPDRDPNLLAYTTEALTQELSVAGPISVHLTAATSAKDTDWFAALQDVYPDGRAVGLCQGILRARFRKSFKQPELLTPGEIADYTIDLWALGNVFQKGHRLRVSITSSCFPLYDRNLNTGEDIATGTKMVKAKQTIYHDNLHVSFIVLPTLPN